MKKNIRAALSISIAILYFGCDNSKDSITSPPVAGLSASASTVILLTDDSTSVVISNGTEPYSITDQANAAIAAVQLDGRVLNVNSKTLGTTTVKVKDSSTPTRTVTVTIKVVAVYTISMSGSLSFNSDRGNFSASGIASLSNTAPTSGSGVIALSGFSGTEIYAYNVNSATSIDIVRMSFQNNSALTVGTYGYPSTGKVVQISYLPNVNPADSLFLDRMYILVTSATATIDSLTSSTIKGTFSGRGFYSNNGTDVLTQTIAIAAGVFNAPILTIGKMQESAVEKIVMRMIKR